MESFVIGMYITDPEVGILGQIKLTLLREKNYKIHEKYQALRMGLCSKVTSNKVCNFFCRLKDLLILGLYGLKDSLIGQNRHKKY